MFHVKHVNTWASTQILKMPPLRSPGLHCDASPHPTQKIAALPQRACPEPNAHGSQPPAPLHRPQPRLSAPITLTHLGSCPKGDWRAVCTPAQDSELINQCSRRTLESLNDGPGVMERALLIPQHLLRLCLRDGAEKVQAGGRRDTRTCC